MTTYNTGNPIGSTDPRDLYDNAENFDSAMHTPETTWTDRLGNTRPSWAGATGYQVLAEYAAGIQVTTYNQVIRAAGEYWRAAAGTALPCTTTGVGMPESGKFVSVGDAVLRGDLVAAGGSDLVGFQQSGAGAVVRTVQEDLREVVKVTQFIAAGETTIDAAFARAIASLTRPGTIEVPQGFWSLAGAVTLRADIPIKIKGAGIYSTVISCTAPAAIASMFTTPSSVSDDTEFEALTLLGNGKAGSAFNSDQLIHSRFDRVQIQGTTAAAIRFNNGYSNTFVDCQIFSNFGNGIECTGQNNNNLNFDRCQIYANDGIGLLLANGFNLRVVGCGIEANRVAGIMAYDLRGLTIRDNYFERNAATGYAYTTLSGSPENVTIKADIHVLAGGRAIGLDESQWVDSCVIDGNQTTPYGQGDVPSAGLSMDCFVFAPSAKNMRVTNNQVLDTAKITYLVGIYNNRTKSEAYSLVVDQNSVNSVGFLGAGLPSFSFGTLHNIDTPTKHQPHNYISQDVFSYTVFSGTSGYFRRSANNFKGYPVYALGGDYAYGLDVDLTKHPELKGNLVWFGLWYQVQDSGSTITLSLGGNTDSDGSMIESAMGTFAFKSVAKLVGNSDTNLYAAFRRSGSGTNPVLVCHPIVSLVGFGAGRYPIPTVQPIFKHTAAPTEGSWPIGARVLHSAPAVGQPKAWQCTASGAPGTWVSEGSL